jgi:phosphoglycerate dehydrogenase-like enzyme
VQVPDAAGYAAALPDADVVVCSMLWSNELIPQAKRLKFVQSISAGIDQYDREHMRAAGIRLANAAGVNAHAVAEHAMALILALKRHLHTGRDHQAARRWRGMISEIAAREDELGGKRLLIVGLGRIGSRLARLAKAFDLEVVGIRRDPGRGANGADAVHGHDRLHELLAGADIVALTCPLTPETTNLIDARALAAMKPGAHLINVARGRVVDEPALIAALQAKRLGAAGLDVTQAEPLPAASPLWAMPNVLITPHTAGETQRYEDGVIDLLLANLERLWRGEPTLVNQVI